MQGDDLLGHLVPLRVGLEVVGRDLLDFLAQLGLGVGILFLLALAVLKEGLVLLVDRAGSGFEACPQFLAQLLGHGAYLAPVVVELLQFPEGGDNVGLLVQGLGFLAQLLLQLQILLEVVVAQFLVHLQHVIETLGGALELLPDLGVGGGGHFAGILEVLLQLLHAVELAVDVVGIVGDLVDEGDDLALLLQIGLAVGLLGGVIFGASFLEHVEQLLEVVLFGILLGSEVALLVAVSEERFPLLGNLLAAQGKEGGLDGLHVILDLLDGAGSGSAHHLHKLAFGLASQLQFWSGLLGGRLLGLGFLGDRLFSLGLLGNRLLGLGLLGDRFLNFNFFIHNFLGLVLGLSAQDLILLEIVHRFRLFTRFHHNELFLVQGLMPQVCYILNPQI